MMTDEVMVIQTIVMIGDGDDYGGYDYKNVASLAWTSTVE